MKRIAYQGINGSFSHLTVQRLFGIECVFMGFQTFREAFEAVEQCTADLALLPIENTLAGTIYETLDLLNEGELYIVGETKTKIEHSLLAIAGSSIDSIRTVRSHPKALAQCSRMLRKRSAIEPIPHFDTAGAAADVAKEKNISSAVIAHIGAASIYGLEVLEENIHDHEENYTRFFLLSKKPAPQGTKCSVCFALPHRAGSLVDVLSLFAQQNLNMTSIVSRPFIGKPFEYLFHIDFDNPLGPFLETLKQKTIHFKCLGIYDDIS